MAAQSRSWLRFGNCCSGDARAGDPCAVGPVLGDRSLPEFQAQLQSKRSGSVFLRARRQSWVVLGLVVNPEAFLSGWLRHPAREFQRQS
eukprot:4667003-Alexandrium_andersonii.AAC.1